MFGDKSKRTTRIAKPTRKVLFALLAFVVGSSWFVIGNNKYKSVVAQSSTPIGSSMEFKRSNASVTLADIYTDKNKDVLIARISMSDSAASMLPYKGSDFRVYISSRSLNGYEEVSVILGKMSTDGDMFLVIPKPNDEVYTVFIMNTKYLGSSGSNTGSKSDNSVAKINDQDEEKIKSSLTKALSTYQYTEDKPDSYKYEVADDKQDVIAFRLTLDPAFTSEEYMPKVLNASLLKGNTFDFKTFFTVVFKESVSNTLQAQYDKTIIEEDQLSKKREELEERLSQNPNDSVAANELEKIKNSLQTLYNKQIDIADQITKYESIKYSDTLFSNLQTKAIVLKK